MLGSSGKRVLRGRMTGKEEKQRTKESVEITERDWQLQAGQYSKSGGTISVCGP